MPCFLCHYFKESLIFPRPRLFSILAAWLHHLACL
nr:MAG TPA: hypothetical protein [Caudoviricetes sp.]DAY98301.1 MAG TPA: hypothetical protein [Caudoviricetes sp.]DAZ01586.1 MAG TPA: hypothetical protein [Caudoviricetes sp.]